MEPVQNFGIHQDEDGLYWLLQKNETLSAIGMPSRECPFEVYSPLLGCPHKFDFTNRASPELMSRFLPFLESSKLLKYIIPSLEHTNVKCIFIETVKPYDLMVIHGLFQLCNPVLDAMMPVFMVKDQGRDKIGRRLQNSNLSRFLMYDASPSNSPIVQAMITSTMVGKGRFFVAGERVTVFGMDQFMIRTEMDPVLTEVYHTFTAAELKQIGNRILYNIMRG